MNVATAMVQDKKYQMCLGGYCTNVRKQEKMHDAQRKRSTRTGSTLPPVFAAAVAVAETATAEALTAPLTEADAEACL